MTLSLQKQKIQCCTTHQHQNRNKVSNYNNDDMPFFYISILWPAGFVTASSVVFLAIAFLYLNNNDYNTGWKSDSVNYIHKYGVTWFVCIENAPYENGMWPSFLRQTQLSHWANVYFRISIMAPMPLRIFFTYILRMYNEPENSQLRFSNLYKFFNGIIPFVAALEILSLTICSILIARFDAAYFLEYAFASFVFTSVIYMYLRNILMLITVNSNKEDIDIASIIMKLFATVTYNYCSLNVFQIYSNFLNNIECHHYVNKNEAIYEYFFIASYLLFHLTLLIDIRKVKFLCYPPDADNDDLKNNLELRKQNLN